MNHTTRTGIASSVAGFTLVELLVAIFVFAILTAMSYPALTHVLGQRENVEAVQLELAALQLGVGLIEADIRAIKPRPVRDELGDDLPALRAGIQNSLLEFSRHVVDVPGTVTPVPGIARIEYRLEDGSLIRRQWSALDRLPVTKFQERTIFEGVDGFSVEFFVGTEWQAFWPATSGRTLLTSLPAAARFRVQFTSGESVSRTVRPGITR